MRPQISTRLQLTPALVSHSNPLFYILAMFESGVSLIGMYLVELPTILLFLSILTFLIGFNLISDISDSYFRIIIGLIVVDLILIYNAYL